MKIMVITILLGIIFYQSETQAAEACNSNGNDYCPPGYHAEYEVQYCVPQPPDLNTIFAGCVEDCNPATHHNNDFYKINYGAFANIKERCICRKVTNNSPTGAAIFVPTKTETEWSAFLSNTPSGVTKSAITCP